MHFNVATLLQEPLGSRRAGRFEDEPLRVPEAGWSAVASGEVRLLRSVRGVLVQARLATAPLVECARCLEPFRQPLRLVIDEEFVAPRDPEDDALRGADGDAIDADDFRVDERQHLDLSEAVRQYEQTALPLQPICRPDCAGLCPACGRDRNRERCGCAVADGAGPWEALAALGDRLRAAGGNAEQDHGATEA